MHVYAPAFQKDLLSASVGSSVRVTPTLKKGTAWSSEVLEYIYKIMWRHILDGFNINKKFSNNFNTSDFSK
jgi:hypothetical protein